MLAAFRRSVRGTRRAQTQRRLRRSSFAARSASAHVLASDEDWRQGLHRPIRTRRWRLAARRRTKDREGAKDSWQTLSLEGTALLAYCQPRETSKSRAERRQRRAFQSIRLPIVEGSCAHRLVEGDRRRVPGEHGPFHSPAATL